MRDRLQELREKNARKELREELEKARELKKDLEDKISFIDLIITMGEVAEGLERVEQKDNQEETIINTDIGKEKYRVITRDDFIRYRLSKLSANQITDCTVNNLKRHWIKISCGFNFMIGIGKDDLTFYNPKFFSENVLENYNEQIIINECISF